MLHFITLPLQWLPLTKIVLEWVSNFTTDILTHYLSQGVSTFELPVGTVTFLEQDKSIATLSLKLILYDLKAENFLIFAQASIK